MHKKITTVLFDLDGTLIDSMGMWGQIDVDFLGSRNIPCPANLQQSIEGLSFRETAVYFKTTFGLPETLEEIETIWNEMAYDMYCHQVPLKPHVREFLQMLQSKNIKMGIATSNSRELTIGVLQAHGVDSYFDAVVTSKEVPNGKPAPDVYLLAAELLQSKPEECVVFEDIPAGLMAGNAAGMYTIAVDDSYSSYCEEEKRKLANYYMMRYEEFMKE